MISAFNIHPELGPRTTSLIDSDEDEDRVEITRLTRRIWNDPRDESRCYLSFEFPLFTHDTNPYSIPSPFTDPRLVHPSIQRGRTVPGWRPNANPPHVFCMHGSEKIEVSATNEYHRTNDLVFISFYPLAEVHPEDTTVDDCTFQRNWCVHYIPRFVILRLARLVFVYYATPAVSRLSSLILNLCPCS